MPQLIERDLDVKLMNQGKEGNQKSKIKKNPIHRKKNQRKEGKGKERKGKEIKLISVQRKCGGFGASCRQKK